MSSPLIPEPHGDPASSGKWKDFLRTCSRLLLYAGHLQSCRVSSDDGLFIALTMENLKPGPEVRQESSTKDKE